MDFNLEEKVDFVLPEKQHFYVGLGWATPADLDLIFVVLDDDKLTDAKNFIYPLNRTHAAVELGEDVQDGGDDDGDDEHAVIHVNELKPNQSIAVLVNIHSAAARGQNFGMVNDAYIRICDGTDENAPELRKYKLQQGRPDCNAVEFCRIVNENGTWTFKPVAGVIDGVNGEVTPIANKYGTGFKPTDSAAPQN